jgi:tRNA (cmo5U34)-methyltransferase
MSRDRIYALPQHQIGNFEFDEQIVEVFPDMIARSVPGYASILSMIEQLTARFSRPNTHLYDLGCSLGAATLLMRQQASPTCTLHAVDSSPAMIARLQGQLNELEQAGTAIPACPVQLHLADIRDFPMQSASFVVLNLTLQFIPAADRTALLNAIAQALIPGGALLLSEKICFDNSTQQALLTELHHDFKRAHGYSDLEIAQKRTAIENRLIPETLEQHTSRLREVGFDVVAPWFQCFNFVSILAIRN